MPITPINSDIVCENPRTSWVMFGVLTIGCLGRFYFHTAWPGNSTVTHRDTCA